MAVFRQPGRVATRRRPRLLPLPRPLDPVLPTCALLDAGDLTVLADRTLMSPGASDRLDELRGPFGACPDARAADLVCGSYPWIQYVDP